MFDYIDTLEMVVLAALFYFALPVYLIREREKKLHVIIAVLIDPLCITVAYFAHIYRFNFKYLFVVLLFPILGFIMDMLTYKNEKLNGIDYFSLGIKLFLASLATVILASPAYAYFHSYLKI